MCVSEGEGGGRGDIIIDMTEEFWIKFCVSVVTQAEKRGGGGGKIILSQT